MKLLKRLEKCPSVPAELNHIYSSTRNRALKVDILAYAKACGRTQRHVHPDFQFFFLGDVRIAVEQCVQDPL